MKPFLAFLSTIFVFAATEARSAPIILFHDEASFLAAAGEVAVENLEDLMLGTVAGSFALPTFTITAYQSLQVLGSSISPYSGLNSAQALINYDYTGQIGLSINYEFLLSEPTLAFGLWVADWGTFGPAGTSWVWTTDTDADPGVVAIRPLPGSCDDTGSPDDCWQFFGFVSTIPFSRVHMSDPDGRGDGYLFDQISVAVPEPTSLVLLGTGIAGLVAQARLRRRQRQKAVPQI